MTRFRMFIDDTGNVHNSASNHPQQRYAGILGVIFDLQYMEDTFRPGFDILRERHFGRLVDGTLPVLHLRKMKSPDQNSVFRCLNDAGKREKWYNGCLSMFRRAKYTVIAVGVDKIDFYARHPDWNGNIYELLVGNAIERYIYFLRNQIDGEGDVEAEATNAKLDRELKELYRKFYNEGTDHLKSKILKKHFTSKEIKIKPKSSENIGLQMADLLASPCLAHLRYMYGSGSALSGMVSKVAQIMEDEKYYRHAVNKSPHGYGRVWRP